MFEVLKTTLIFFFFFCSFVLVNAQVVVHQENFGTGLGTWSAVNILDATDVWTNASGFAEINGIGGTNDEDWLISPSINMNAQTNEFLLFDYNDDFDGDLIKVFYATNYNGGGTSTDVTNATWTELSNRLININRTSCFSTLFQRHPAIDVSGISGTSVRFAFKYVGTSASSKYYKIDNVRILADYYAGIGSTIKCCDLKTALHNLIKTQTYRIGYTAATYDVWDAMLHSDVRINDAGTDTITSDVFTDKPFGTGEFEFDPCTGRAGVATCTVEGTCYQREHSFPKSWWGGGTAAADTAYTDMHHLMPADGFLNGAKSNFPPGVVLAAATTGTNGFKVGTNTTYPCSATMNYFEPIDEYKGDYARMYFFIATRYQHLMATWESIDTRGDCALDGNPCIGFEPWMLNVLLTWHANDPVSLKEINRNNAVYAIQGNRNPFIDKPQWVNMIWGDANGTSCTAFTLPVELIEFDLKKSEERAVIIHWETASERDNDYFVVEKSRDGSTWEEVGKVGTKGNGSLGNTYKVIDNEIVPIMYYYRLTQFDLNGEKELLDTKVIDLRNQMTTVYPNPFTDNLYFEFDKVGQKRIKIYNELGQLMLETMTESKKQTIDSKSLSKGFYTVIVDDEMEVYISRLIKL